MLVASHVERAAEIKMHLWDSTGGSPQPHLQTWNPRQAERCFGLAPEKLCSVTEITVKQNLHGKISMGSGGNGSPAHVTGELFKMMTGVNLTHVPYRGAGPAITDLLGGQIQVTFTDMAASIEYIRAGKLRALAVTTATRSEALPDIPTRVTCQLIEAHTGAHLWAERYDRPLDDIFALQDEVTLGPPSGIRTLRSRRRHTRSP